VNRTNNEVSHYVSVHHSIRVYKFKRLISARCDSDSGFAELLGRLLSDSVVAFETSEITRPRTQLYIL